MFGGEPFHLELRGLAWGWHRFGAVASDDRHEVHKARRGDPKTYARPLGGA